MTTNSISGYNPINGSVVDLDGNTAGIIGWSVIFEKGSEMIAIEDIRHAMRVSGLDETLVTDNKKENSMRKTMSDLKKNKVINEIPQKTKNDAVMVFQFDEKVIEDLSGELQLRFKKVGNLKFDLSSGVIDCEDPVIREFATERVLKRMRSYDKAQFHAFLLDLVEVSMGRKIVNITKGNYFVDVSKEVILKKIVQMLSICDKNVRVKMLPLLKEQESVGIAVDSTAETYSGEVEKILLKVEEDKIANGGTLSDKIAKNALIKLQDLEGMCVVSLAQLNAKTDLVKDSFDRCRDFIKNNKERLALTEAQKQQIATAKYAIEKGLPKESVASMLALEGLTLEDLDRTE